MKKTLKMVDGDISFNFNGVAETVTGIEKSGQDAGYELLKDFNAFFNEGNELLSLTPDNSAFGITNTIATQYIYECMTRLIVKQQSYDERIIKIQDIKTQMSGLTTMVFLVELLFSSGTTISVVDKVTLKPTSLGHIFNLNGILSV